MIPLRRRMIEDMTVRNLSRSTQQSYIYAVAKFSQHFNRAPDQLGMEEVRTYQLHLVAQKRSWSHINQDRSRRRHAVERHALGSDSSAGRGLRHPRASGHLSLPPGRAHASGAGVRLQRP
jgi:hypothetical protein